MANLLKSAQALAVASAMSTTSIAGPAQVQPLGTISISNDFIAGSAAWIARRRVAQHEATQATKHLASLNLIVVEGVLTHRSLCAE